MIFRTRPMPFYETDGHSVADEIESQTTEAAAAAIVSAPAVAEAAHERVSELESRLWWEHVNRLETRLDEIASDVAAIRKPVEEAAAEPIEAAGDVAESAETLPEAVVRAEDTPEPKKRKHFLHRFF